MGFDEIQFPTDIGYGSLGGPGFNTAILTTDSGHEERVPRWVQARRRYDVAYGIKTLEQLQAVMTFYIGRLGPAQGFRYKDWFDFSTASDHVSTPSNTDQTIGVGDGATTTFQLRKTYTSGTQNRIRTLEKPVSGTTVVSLDDVDQASGWTVNTTDGVITFSVAPTGGQVVKAGCEFDVPVRFGRELDELFPMTYDAFEEGSVSSIVLVELKSEINSPEEAFMGGSTSFGAVGSNVSLTVGNGRVVSYSPTANIDVILPVALGSAFPPGGPYWIIFNDSGSFTLRIVDGVIVLGTIAVGSAATIVLEIIDGSGTLAWRLY